MSPENKKRRLAGRRFLCIWMISPHDPRLQACRNLGEAYTNFAIRKPAITPTMATSTVNTLTIQS